MIIKIREKKTQKNPTGNEAAAILDFQASLSCKKGLFISPQIFDVSATASERPPHPPLHPLGTKTIMTVTPRSTRKGHPVPCLVLGQVNPEPPDEEVAGNLCVQHRSSPGGFLQTGVNSHNP